jgi:hypothetical protein
VSDQAFVIRRVPTHPREPEELLDDRVFLDRGAADDACAQENAAFIRPRYEVVPRRLVGAAAPSPDQRRLDWLDGNSKRWIKVIEGRWGPAIRATIDELMVDDPDPPKTASPASALSQRLRTYFDADDDDEDHGAIRALMLEAAEEIDRLTRGL